jgi:hypothetical protein
MATISGTRSETATLVAATADSVTLSQAVGKPTARFEVSHHSDVAVPIYVNSRGVAATVGGDNCAVILPGDTKVVGCTSEGAISLISSGIPTYTVELLT